MSQQARAMVQPSAEAIAGSTARSLPTGGVPQQHPVYPQRTPLSLVPARNSRRRTPFVVFCFLTLAAALVGVLVLNVSVSSGQYQLVELHNKKASLVQENEMLTQEVKNHLAPQNLASEAAELGMVSAPTFGTIDLDNMTVAGTPKPAEDTERSEALIPAPDVAIQSTMPEATPAAPAESAQNETAATPADEEKSVAPDSQSADGTPAEGGAAEPNESAGDTAQDQPAYSDNVAPAPVEPEQKELNGGTIPAPQQQTAQQ